MKRLELKKLITCALIISTVTSIGVIPAKATTTSDLYKQAYDATMNVIETGKKYNITPRHADNNTDLKSNKIYNVYKAVEEGNMQKAINHARECIAKLPSNQWQAQNTFSNLLDGYQQPSYEHIVDVALQLNKLTKQDENKFINPTSWDESKKKEFCNTVKERQHYIEIARALNKGVDPTYGKTYSSTLDKPQQTVINMVNDVVENAKKSSNPSDIEFAENVIKAFKESVSENSNIKNYVTGLQKDMDSLVELAKKNKFALEAQAKEIEALKEEVAKLKNESHKEDFEKEINSLKTEIANLKNTSHTIVSIPSNQDVIDNQAKLIKELQDKINNLSNLLGKAVNITDKGVSITGNTLLISPLFDVDQNKKLLDKANNALDIIQNNFNERNLNKYLDEINSFLNYDRKENQDQRDKMCNRMYTIAKPIVEKAISENNTENLMLANRLISIKYDKNEKIKNLQNKILQQKLKNVSRSLKNIQEEYQVNDLKNELGQFFGWLGECQIEKTSPIYPKLVEVCNQYVNTSEKFIKEAKNTKTLKNILITTALINTRNIVPESKEKLIKLTYDFVEFSLNPKNTTIDFLDSNRIQELIKILLDNKSGNIDFYNLLLKRFQNIINSGEIKDYDIALKLSNIISRVGYSFSEKSSEHKQFMELQNKLEKLKNELQKEQQGHHQVIKPSQQDKEKEIQKQIVELESISNDIKNVKIDLDMVPINTEIQSFANKNLDPIVGDKYNLVVNEYVNILKQQISKLEKLEIWRVLNLVKDFENNISKNNTQKLEMEDCLIKKIRTFVNSINLVNDKNDFNNSISILNQYKMNMVFQGIPYNEKTYNEIFNIYNDLAKKLIKNIKEDKKYNLIYQMECLIQSFKENDLSKSKFYVEGEKLEKQLNVIKNEIAKDKQDTGVSTEKK